MADDRVINLAEANRKLIEKRQRLTVSPPSEPPMPRSGNGNAFVFKADEDSRPMQIGNATAQVFSRIEPVEPPADNRTSSGEPADLVFWKRAARLRPAMESAGVWPEFIKASLADFPQFSMEIAEQSALVTGPVGVGKSRLAAALVRVALLSGRTARFVLAGDLFSEIRETYRDESEQSERQVVESLCSFDLLVIDDLAREGGFRGRQSSEHVMSILHRVLSKRNGALRRTVVTTNLTIDEIEAAYDSAIASRLGSYRELVLLGSDRRRQ